ncbi:MAG: hypothetical protein Q4A03_04960 [Rothia sp. (in: high G+C Gram-positive bacteria)]|uniref:hypothetical protein n=1 Tax=Rothia sp. (in: high G+C Gram-positive bacteria) TaxID=1885016 RepID=UPI002701A943|nr:hypothetical protein [Rothia sp. (in: high G+C Gram-positive bacteria)]
MPRRALPLALLIPLLAACSSGASTTAEAPSSTPSVRTTVPPPATTATASPEELATQGPTISNEDIQRGIDTGNVYVLYSGVMCFGGTLADPAEFATQELASDYMSEEEYQQHYSQIPAEVLTQSEKNKTSIFTAPQECLDAGWSQAGAI